MGLEDDIVTKLESHNGRMNQDALVDSLPASKGEVMHAARDLYDEGELGYSKDWQMMLEE